MCIYELIAQRNGQWSTENSQNAESCFFFRAQETHLRFDLIYVIYKYIYCTSFYLMCFLCKL